MHRLVETRMALIAPNMVAMLGAATTAMLVGLCILSSSPNSEQICDRDLITKPSLLKLRARMVEQFIDKVVMVVCE